jgi:hypothetical protein
LIAWVQVPTVSPTGDTLIYIYYGNASAADQQNQTGVWDSGFKLVQHLQQTSGVTTYDSTSNGNNGTKVSATSPTATAAGEIGGAQSFDGSGDYIFNSGPNNLPALNGSQTISTWLYYSSASSRAIAFGLPLNDGYSAGASTDLELLGGGNIGIAAWGGGAVVSATAPASNAWHLVAYTYDGSTNRLYIDGVLQASK